MSDDDGLRDAYEAAAERFPELAPEWLEGEALRVAEPALGEGLYAYRVNAGRPIGPTAATRAWGERARAAGARLVLGDTARVSREGGVVAGGEVHAAGAVVVAAGPWTPEAVGGGPTWRPVQPNGASSRRCSSATRRATRSSRPASRR